MAEPTNAEVAGTLERYATLLEVSGGTPFRVRAYRRAADAIRFFPEPIAEVHRQGRLRSIPGVGEGIAGAVADLLATGSYRPLEELQQTVPASVLDLLGVPGVGVKTATRLYQELGITDLSDLEAAAVAGRLRPVRGLGGRLENVVLAGLESLRRRTGRTPLGVALPLGRRLVADIERLLPTARVSLAGSVRRMEETVGDIDLVVGSADPRAALRSLATLPHFAEVVRRGPDRLQAHLQSGLKADLIVAHAGRFGTALVQATGSELHVERLGAHLPEAATEQEVYRARGTSWIPPELRRGGDEFDRTGDIDRLLTIEDIRGEFHSHSTWSDGAASITEMAAAAAERGYQFLGISDHSRGLAVANGLDPARLAAQRREIEAAGSNQRVWLFAGSEVEVSRDGRLDFDDNVLAELDVVIASLHVGLRQPRGQLTERLVGVLNNPNVDIVAHPSGRLIERREGGDFDWDRVFTVAAQTGTALEINADPARFDLSDRLAEQALKAGCLLTINCDAHHPNGIAALEYGIAVARRACAQTQQILNC